MTTTGLLLKIVLATLSSTAAVRATSAAESVKTALYNPWKVLRKIPSTISCSKPPLETNGKVWVASCLEPEDGGPKPVTVTLQEVSTLVSDNSVATVQA